MTTFPAIQAYFAPSSVAVGLTGYMDRAHGTIMGIYNSTHDLAYFNFFSGALLSHQHLDDLGIPGTTRTAAIDSPDGRLWCPSTGGSALEICRVDPTTSPWTLNQSWGTGGVPTGVPYPNSMAWLQIGNGGWLANGASTGGKVDVLQANPGTIGFWGHNFSASGSNFISVVPGPQSTTSATAYWLGQDFKLGKTTIQAAALLYDPGTWPTPNSQIASSVIKTYVPTDFDAAWGAITLFAGPAYDQSDGNVIVQVEGTGGGNPNYIAKLSTADGSVLWKVPVSSGAGFDKGIVFSRIQNGLFLYYAQVSTFAGTLYVINTGTGASTTTSINGLLSINFQASDDALGCIIGECQWDSGHGSLRLLNGTPSSGGPTLSAVYFIAGEPRFPHGGAIGYTRLWGRFN